MTFTWWTDDGVTQTSVGQKTATVATNVATVTFAAADTAAVGVFKYELFDVSDKVAICRGTMEIQPAKQTYP